MSIDCEGSICKQSSEKQEKGSDEVISKCVPIRGTPIAASVNSNVQSINNSLLNETKCERRKSRCALGCL